MSIYIAHRRDNASNALDVPSTVKKGTSSVYDKNSQFAWNDEVAKAVEENRRCYKI